MRSCCAVNRREYVRNRQQGYLCNLYLLRREQGLQRELHVLVEAEIANVKVSNARAASVGAATAAATSATAAATAAVATAAVTSTATSSTAADLFEEEHGGARAVVGVQRCDLDALHHHRVLGTKRQRVPARYLRISRAGP